MHHAATALARTLLLGAVVLAAAAPLGAQTRAASGSPLHERYGFDGVINSKFNDGIGGLRAADVDGDGRTDLLLINNGKARLEILRQRHDGEELPPFDPESYNDLPDDTYFVRESLATEQKVTSLAVADLDGDGHPDIAWLGESGKLTVTYGSADGEWGRELRLPVTRHSDRAEAVRVGDIDGDGRTDVAVLGERDVQCFLQGADGVLTPRPGLPSATAKPDGFDLVDVNGDGRLDLFFLAADDEWPFRFRLGLAQRPGEAAFGPEIRSRFDPVRSYALGDVDGDGRVELGAVRRRSGRLALLRYEAPVPGADRLSSPRQLPFGDDADSGRRESVLADLDGDGRLDLLVAEPKASRLVYYRSTGGAQFREEAAYPSFIGSSQPRVADVDGDGTPEVVVLAPDEGAVGISDVEADGRVGFPAAHPAPGEDLLALDVADQDGDGLAEVWVLTGDGKSRSRKYALTRLALGPTAAAEFEIEDVEADPNGLLLVDLDRDGAKDALLFIPTRNPRLLLWRADGWLDVDVEEVPGLSLLKGLSRDALSVGDVDGDGLSELLAPGPSFARAFWLRADPDAPGVAPVVEVVGQYNLDDPGAQVGAVALADLGGRGRPDVVLHEKGRGELHVLRPGDDGPTTATRLELGGLSPALIVAADMDGDGRHDLVLPAGDRVAVVLNGRSGPRFVADREYELPVQNPNLDRLAFGDVNGDGAADLVVTETNRHMLAIAALTGDTIEHALRFPIFEAKLFSIGRGGREPRELVLADVTGDGLLDVAIVVHDRVLVYPQDRP